MEMMRNPNMFQELMRNHDQAIRNLQVCIKIFYFLFINLCELVFEFCKLICV